MSQAEHRSFDEAHQIHGPWLVVLHSWGRVMTCQGPAPWCAVIDPQLYIALGRGPHRECSQWHIRLGDTKSTSCAFLVLDSGAVRRTLVFSLCHHETLLRAIWLEGRLIITGEDYPPVLVYDVPRQGLETVLQHGICLGAREAATVN